LVEIQLVSLAMQDFLGNDSYEALYKKHVLYSAIISLVNAKTRVMLDEYNALQPIFERFKTSYISKTLDGIKSDYTFDTYGHMACNPEESAQVVGREKNGFIF